MKKYLVGFLGAACALTASSAFAQVCGNNDLESPPETCDDGNAMSGDGCSVACLIEPNFTCELVTFTVDLEEDLGVGGDAINWVLDADNRGIVETANSVAGIYSTNMPADIGEIVFDMRVETTTDDDFFGWTIGYDTGELSATAAPASTDYLLFHWKQQQQNAFGGMRHSGMGLSRITGSGSDADYWSGQGPNISLLAVGNNFPIDEGLPNGERVNGWADNTWYRVNMVVTPGRVRVWIRQGNTANTPNPTMRGFAALDRVADLEFDVRTTIPAGNFGFYAFSQPSLRYDLVGPFSDSVCARDKDEDGIKDLTDLDSDRDGIPDRVEMAGFIDDPDADEDLDGIPDWNDPDHVPGGCPSAAGACTSLPMALDIDGDGIPNHLDLDSDGDGVSDAREAGLVDDDGDGRPDACVAITDRGECVAGGLGTEPPTSSDADGRPDFLDPDSDGDGISDFDEAYDTDGDGVADATAASADTNNNGIDDRFDPSCTIILCGGIVGVPVTGPLTVAQDSDGDGVPDWQTVCGDAYLTGAEVCDDGNNDETDSCNNSCLLTLTIMCTLNSECASDACDPVLMNCQVCRDDTAILVDRGCTLATPACLTTGTTNSCVECTGDAQCGVGRVCSSANLCVVCDDTAAGAGQDLGCSPSAPICDASGGAPVCQRCVDDAPGGADTGCPVGAPVCDVAAGGNSCIVCEDTAAGTAMDFGCAAAGAPVCLEPIGMSPMCVECAGDVDCPAMGEVCDADNRCVPGCNDASDCAGALPICDVAGRVCVECLATSDCSGDESCGLGGTCRLPDSDGDGIDDAVDLDDDNDGVLDIDEGDGTDYSVDSDGDGFPDWKDPDAVTCDDVDGDGICDELPLEVDLDQDGIPNHLDLDADGDGIADLIEGGGDDVGRDGRVDGFVDLDRNGVDDALDAAPLAVPDTDGDGSKNFLDRDSDGDGLTDAFEAGGTDANGDGVEDTAFVDANDDGLNDNLVGAGALPLINTDSTDGPDYVDTDSDQDGVDDLVEGHLALSAVGLDTDGDGIDDAFDPDCVVGACGGTIGTISSVPNTDSNGEPDFRDVDADGDGILDGAECPMRAMCLDTDGDGTPDFRSLDADGDGLVDAVEGHDSDHDGTADVVAVGNDTDGDGLDDAFDADCTTATPCGAVVGVPATLPDLDEDDAPDYRDADDDGDGKPTADEIQDAADYVGPAADSTNIDGDALVNWFDTDSDGDGASDMSENAGDGDANDDGLLDYLDPDFSAADSDGDGIIDIEECGGPPAAGCVDSDDDGTPDYLDVDDDNDGILTRDEYSADDFDDGDPANDHDADNDGVPNHLDLDSDNDGIPDLWENGGRGLDANGDGRPDDASDADGDGLIAAFDADDTDALRIDTRIETVDTDGTGQADYLDLDADGDGLSDLIEAGGTDADGNGQVDSPSDTDTNGWADALQTTPWPLPDTDDDGFVDFQDTDSDGDGKPDLLEANDGNGDGVGDVVPVGVDANGNGIDDRFDAALGGASPSGPDTDEDGTPDWRDVDDDGDGVFTALEDGDTDGDGTPDYLDVDDDGDGVFTQFEGADPNGDGDPSDAQDTDGDTVPDYLDDDDDGDGLPTVDEMADPNGDGDPSDAVDGDEDSIPDYLDPRSSSGGGVAGGAACAASPGSSQAPHGLWFLVALAAWMRRRRS